MKWSLKISSWVTPLGPMGTIRNPPPAPVGCGVPPKELLFLPQMALSKLGWFCSQKKFPAYEISLRCSSLAQRLFFLFFLQKSLELADLTQNPFTERLGKSYLSLMPPMRGEGDDSNTPGPPTF